MVLTLRALMLVVAVICFILAALGVGLPRLGLQSVGLAFFAAAFLVP